MDSRKKERGKRSNSSRLSLVGELVLNKELWGSYKKEKETMKRDMKDVVKRHSSIGSVFAANRFDDLFSEVHALMDHAWNNWDLSASAFHALQPKANFPKINVAETDSAYEVEIAISGFDKDNLELEFKDSCLFIKADKANEQEEEGKKWLRKEISSRAFRRALQFPLKIDSSLISSAYDEAKGIVTCVLPKQLKKELDVVKIKIK